MEKWAKIKRRIQPEQLTSTFCLPPPPSTWYFILLRFFCPSNGLRKIYPRIEKKKIKSKVTLKYSIVQNKKTAGFGFNYVRVAKTKRQAHRAPIVTYVRIVMRLKHLVSNTPGPAARIDT